jgi:hypothetical protein
MPGFIEAGEVQPHLSSAKDPPALKDKTKDSSQLSISHKKPERPYESLVGSGMSRGYTMEKAHPPSIIAIILISTMLASCATNNLQSPFSQFDPCQPGGGQASFSPQSSFIQQAILNPLANIGGTLLATAAQNYSEKYTGKLNKLLTKLVTPKKKKKKKSNQQAVDQGNQFDNQGGQPDFGFENQVDPNTGFPIQDPSEFPGRSQYGFPHPRPLRVSGTRRLWTSPRTD